MEIGKKRRAKLLFIDDSEEVLGAYENCVQTLGDMYTATSGNAAIDLFRKERCDVIVTDYNMKDGTGLEVLKFVAEQAPEVPVIMITAYGSKYLAVEAAQSHVFAYLEKPCAQEKFLNMLEKAIDYSFAKQKERKMVNLGKMASELAHDLSTPLMVINESSDMIHELVEQQKYEPTPYKKNVVMIKKQVGRAQNILGNLKAMLRNEHEDHNTTFDVMMLVTELREQYNTKTIVEIVEQGIANAKLHADYSRLMQVFTNLVNNAMDAAEELDDSWVRVEFSIDRDNLMVKVVDCGLGIPKNVAEKMFDELYTTKQPGKGTGLGLDICKKIVDAMKGKVWYDDKATNTTFCVQLPLKKN